MNRIRIIIVVVIFAMHSVCAHAQMINKVVAVVNDEVITQQDVNQLLSVIYAQYVQTYSPDELLKKMEDVKKDILHQMIEDRLILSRAKELEIRVRESEIDEKLESVRAGFPSEKEFYDMLETQGITIADLKKRYRDQIMMKKIVDLEVRARVSVLPSEISDYYEEHRAEFKMNQKYKVRHILIRAEDDVGFELAKVEIEDIYNKLKEGHDFDVIARRYSQGPNKEQGGDMGYIGRGEMLEELDDVVFSLKEGQVSSPVQSQIGYHIFKVEDIRHSGYLSLEDVQDRLKEMLYRKKLKERLDEWLAELRAKAYISIK